MVMWVSVTALPTVVNQKMGSFRWVRQLILIKLLGVVPIPEY